MEKRAVLIKTNLKNGILCRSTVYLTALAALLLSALSACGAINAQGGTLKVGHGGGYLSAVMYAAEHGADVRQFCSSPDIAYALISGALDAGFVESERLAALSRLKGFETLAVVGKVTYPYGATLVLRKGLNARLTELDGFIIAASEPDCVLKEAFADDALRLNADLSGVRYKYMPFDAMLPALEAGTVDAAIIKGTYAVLALDEGHSILYQNWEVEPGDECCPAIIDQAALILLARRGKLDAVKPFVNALVHAQGLPPDDLRRAVESGAGIPFDVLSGQPVPEFSVAGDELIEIFIEAASEDEE